MIIPVANGNHVMHTQVFETKLPEPLPTFEAMVQEGDEYPSVCVGVRQG